MADLRRPLTQCALNSGRRAHVDAITWRTTQGTWETRRDHREVRYTRRRLVLIAFLSLTAASLALFLTTPATASRSLEHRYTKMARYQEDDGYVEDSEGEDMLFDARPAPSHAGLPPLALLNAPSLDDSGTLTLLPFEIHCGMNVFTSL